MPERAGRRVPKQENQMKIKELADRTKVSKQAIHHYINEGIIPRGRKLGRNVASYDDRHVEYLSTINELRELYLPLSEIKAIMRKEKRRSKGDLSLLRLRSRYCQPVEQLSPGNVVGRKAFEEATGLSPKWRRKYEEWDVITPEAQSGRWVYSQDNVVIGRLIVEMGTLGIEPENDFDPEELRRVADLFRESITKGRRQFLKAFCGKLSEEEITDKGQKINEVMSLFYYHLYRKESRMQT